MDLAVCRVGGSELTTPGMVSVAVGGNHASVGAHGVK